MAHWAPFWRRVFWAWIICDLTAGFAALLRFKPVAARTIERLVVEPVTPKAA